MSQDILAAISQPLKHFFLKFCSIYFLKTIFVPSHDSISANNFFPWTVFTWIVSGAKIAENIRNYLHFPHPKKSFPQTLLLSRNTVHWTISMRKTSASLLHGTLGTWAYDSVWEWSRLDQTPILVFLVIIIDSLWWIVGPI